MQNKIQASDLSNGLFELDQEAQSKLDQVINTNFGSLMDTKMYIIYFKQIPNIIDEKNINMASANEWFLSHYKSKIIDCFFSKKVFKENSHAAYDDIIYFIEGNIALHMEIEFGTFRILYRGGNADFVEELYQSLIQFKEVIKHSNIDLLVNSNNRLSLESLEITNTKGNIEDHYNNDLLPIHDVIKERLTKDKDKGLVLLHGKPGTGKTSYIRHLLSFLDKKVIFISPKMATALTSPDFISILIENKNSILVIEDAENIVIDRDQDNNSPVSAILNLSDGLLSDCLNIQVICSFNTDLSKIDSALLRKGRLIAKYCFEELSVEKANALSKKLGKHITYNEPTTLTEIYNAEEMSFSKDSKKHQIGFGMHRKVG